MIWLLVFMIWSLSLKKIKTWGGIFVFFLKDAVSYFFLRMRYLKILFFIIYIWWGVLYIDTMRCILIFSVGTLVLFGANSIFLNVNILVYTPRDGDTKNIYIYFQWLDFLKNNIYTNCILLKKSRDRVQKYSNL